MAHLYALSSIPLPEKLHGKDADCSIRPLCESDRLTIEDCFFASGANIQIGLESTAVVVSQPVTYCQSLEEYGTFIEFALALLTTSGFQPIEIVASLADASCTRAIKSPEREGKGGSAQFAPSIDGDIISNWLPVFFQARKNSADRMHITADRFVRYLRDPTTADSLTDLCISLESLFEASTELKFRFCTCLAKVTGAKGEQAEKTAILLEGLYDLRSKIVHGDPSAARVLKKMQPDLHAIRRVARRVLINYVLFMSEHTRGDWKQHLRTLLFA
jgi:Apea-like HEPN